MTIVEVPSTVDCADELLGAARRLIDAETVLIEADPRVTVSCRSDCNACCEHAVVVTAAETRAIARAINDLTPAVQEQIARRATQVRQRVERDLDEQGDFARRYYALGEPCPLLIDGRCSVREVRPLVCRDYLICSPPEHCFDPSLAQVVQIRRKRDVAANFRDISAQFGESGGQLLPVALSSVTPAVTSKPMSGPKLARRLVR